MVYEVQVTMLLVLKNTNKETKHFYFQHITLIGNSHQALMRNKNKVKKKSLFSPLNDSVYKISGT